MCRSVLGHWKHPGSAFFHSPATPPVKQLHQTVELSPGVVPCTMLLAQYGGMRSVAACCALCVFSSLAAPSAVWPVVWQKEERACRCPPRRFPGLCSAPPCCRGAQCERWWWWPACPHPSGLGSSLRPHASLLLLLLCAGATSSSFRFCAHRALL